MIGKPAKHQKSFAARFREVFELAEQNGGVLPEMPEPRVSHSDLASRFRKAFEAAEQGAGTVKEAPSLAYYEKGVPLITAIEGIKRYVYANGTIDERSTVSPEVEARAFEIGIGNIATRAEMIDEEPKTGPEEDLGAISVAESAVLQEAA
ncbi:MAG TPA: hypothetical protein VFX86_02545 [Candidatus Saccharimonadales bacterium]|nr:hypothetical protein [Candidatus Saccharimonadales bacterium]